MADYKTNILTALLNNAFFSNDASGNKKSAAEKTTMGLLDIGLSAAKDQLKYATFPTSRGPLTSWERCL